MESLFINDLRNRHGSWIYSYLCNKCLSLLKLWIRTPFIERCTWYNIMWSGLSSVTCDRSVVFSWTPVSSTNKTDRHDIAEMALHHKPTPKPYLSMICTYSFWLHTIIFVIKSQTWMVIQTYYRWFLTYRYIGVTDVTLIKPW